MLNFFEILHFSYLILNMGKMGYFKKSNMKSGHFKKNVINFKTEKEPQMIFFDFAVFSKYSENSEFRFKPI